MVHQPLPFNIPFPLGHNDVALSWLCSITLTMPSSSKWKNLDTSQASVVHLPPASLSNSLVIFSLGGFQLLHLENVVSKIPISSCIHSTEVQSGVCKCWTPPLRYACSLVLQTRCMKSELFPGFSCPNTLLFLNFPFILEVLVDS